MKVLFITHNDGLLGSSRSLLDLLAGLQKYQVDPIVVIPNKGLLAEKLISLGIPANIIPLPWWLYKKADHRKSTIKDIREELSTVKRIVSLIKNQDVDLVYTNSSVTPAGRIAAMLAGIPHIWHIREFGDLDFSLYPVLPRPLFKRFIYSSQALIFNSLAIREYYFQKRKNSKIHVIYNGVASSEQLSKNKFTDGQESQSEEYTFLFMGSISAPKGLEEAIRAIGELRLKGVHSRLLIAGTGKQVFIQKCTDLAAVLQVSDSIEFMGYLDDPYEAYSSSDCLLMCSKNEAFGRVTAEAMAAGLPVIGRNSGGTPEVIVDGVTGILYNTFDELVEAMRKLAQDRPLSRKMGLAGWERARELFSIEKYAASVYQVIQSVMNKA